MAKKLGKLVLFSALTGAAAAGTYYCLKKKSKTPEAASEDFDDFDDFDEDLENEDFSSGTAANSGSKGRPHIPLDIDSAKEAIGEKVIEKLDKAKEFISGMTSPSAEPVYTQVDMPAQAAESADAGQEATEEFFDDTKPDTDTVHA